MGQTSNGWPSISSALFYEEAGAAIDWLCKAFGFAVRVRFDGDDGRVEHSELTFGDGVVMIGSPGDPADPHKGVMRSPRAVGGVNTQSLCLYVDDVDAHCERARAAGAEILREPTTDDYGEGYGAHRTYQAMDPEGHRWWFMQQVRGPKAK